jgi:predicted alpha/beta hydrolase family esterase
MGETCTLFMKCGGRATPTFSRFRAKLARRHGPEHNPRRMKHRLLFVQGGGKGTHDEWDSKLVASLGRQLGSNYEIRYPRMPSEEEPSYAPWKAALERELAALPDGAILVGHSLGAAILIKVLVELRSVRACGAIFSIAAPFFGDGGWLVDDVQLPPDLGARLPRGIPIHFFHGLDDAEVPPSHLELYARAVPPAHIHRLRGRDHQLNDDLTEVAAVIASLETRP